jgi:hypothetical protein
VLATLPKLPSGEVQADRALLLALQPKLQVLQPLLAGASMTMAEVGPYICRRGSTSRTYPVLPRTLLLFSRGALGKRHGADAISWIGGSHASQARLSVLH